MTAVSEQARLLPSLDFPERLAKPRTTGWNMISDHGPVTAAWLGSAGLADLLDAAGWHVDYAKVRADLHRLTRPDWVRNRLELYRRHDVNAYPGGIVMEIAILQHREMAALDDIKAIDYWGFELSENLVSLTPARRRELIAAAGERGLNVVYELGRKFPQPPAMDPQEAADIVADVRDAGVALVVVERDEIDLWRSENPALLHRFVELVPQDGVAYEAGPDRFPELPVWLIEQFGPDVSLANLQGGQVLSVERYRLGLDRAVGYRFLTEQQTDGAHGH